MANRIEIVIDSVTKGLESGLRKSQGGFARFQKAALGVGAVLVGGLAYGLDKSVHAALNAQKANARLGVAFRNAGLDAGKYADAIDKAESSGRKLGFTDEDTKNSLGSLITATHSMAAAQKDLTTAQDIARFKGVSLTDATKMLTMAMTGSQRAAKQLGISVQPVTTNFDALSKSADSATKAHARFLDKELTGQATIDAVNAKLHGQAEAFSQTAAGGMEQFRAQLEHLEVSLGTGLLPILAQVASALAVATEFFSKHTTATKVMVTALGALGVTLLAISAFSKLATAATTLWSAATKIATGLQWLFNAALAANPIGIVVVSIAALTAALVILQVKYHAVTAAVDFLKDHYYLLMAVPIVGWAATVAVAMITNWDRISGAVGAAAARVAGAIMGVVHAIQTLVGWITSAISAVEALIGALGRIHVPSIHIPHVHIPGLAGGTKNFSGGMALVGEKGPELVNLPGGSSVTPNSALGGTYVIQLVADGKVLAETVFDPMRAKAQVFKTQTGRTAFA